MTVYAFFSKAASDPLLANRLKAFDTVEAVVQLASEAGFAFTAEQFVQALRQASREAATELDDDALESVTGGRVALSDQFGGIPFDSLIGKPLQ